MLHTVRGDHCGRVPSGAYPQKHFAILLKWQNFAVIYSQNEQHVPFRGDECTGQGRIWTTIPGREEKFFIDVCNESRKWSQPT